MGTMVGSFRRQITAKPKPLPKQVRFDGKTAIVTGANGGLGLEASKEMIAHGLSRIILAVRNIESSNTARNKILTSSSNCNAEVWEVDYESFASIMAFGARASKLNRLDIVILNAGIKVMEFSHSVTGHEKNVQVNHLGTALLSLLLLEPLKRTAEETSAPSRLTFVTSEVHFWTLFSEKNAASILERMDEEESFNKSAAIERYNTSKLLGVLWTRELANKVDEKTILVNCVNPGICSTSLYHSDPTPGLGLMLKMLAWSPTMGAHTLTNAVVYHDGKQGAYLSEQRVTSPSSFATSAEGEKVQKKLWDETIAVFRKEAPDFDIPSVLN
ncbi:short-chain dehydrogenase/reductase SDR [Xylaria arbuscula]|nr:short-chain dehydrogenase/reductase SDR [Xylaria arbuscula]